MTPLWPISVTWGAKYFEDLEDLIYFWVSFEERMACCHFAQNAPYWPNIDRSRILLAAQQYFRRSIPERNDLVGVHLHRNAEGACETKISEFHISWAGYEDILGLDISVDTSSGVTEL